MRHLGLRARARSCGEGDVCAQVWQAATGQKHGAAVKSLQFQKMADGSVKLASAGADHGLRVMHVVL